MNRFNRNPDRNASPAVLTGFVALHDALSVAMRRLVTILPIRLIATFSDRVAKRHPGSRADLLRTRSVLNRARALSTEATAAAASADSGRAQGPITP